MVASFLFVMEITLVAHIIVFMTFYLRENVTSIASFHKWHFDLTLKYKLQERKKKQICCVSILCCSIFTYIQFTKQ